MSGLLVSAIDNCEAWHSLAAEWNDVLNESEAGSIFLTWEWLYSWAECCLGENRSLFILVFYEKDKVVGFAPFYIERIKFGPFCLREVRLLGAPESGSDYLTVFAQRGMEKEVANALYDYLMGDGVACWDQLALGDIPADSLFLFHFVTRMEAERKCAELGPSAYCPTVKLPATEAEYHALLSASWKKKFKQNIRIIHREPDVIHAVIHGREVSARLDDFFRLYEEKAGWSGGTVRCLLPQMIEKYINEPPVQLDLLSVNGQMVAGFLHLHYRNTLYLYLMAVDKSYSPKVSLGNYLVGQSINNAIASGFSVYDFLKGNEHYKFHWATGGKRTLQLLFWKKRPAALACALVKLSRKAGKLLLR